MKITMKIHSKQTGAVLITSLLILLVMTIIGVSSIGSTNLEERMAQNFQNIAITFQAAESAINKVVNASNPGGSGASSNPFYDAANDPVVAAVNAGIGDTSTVVNHDSSDLDPGSYLVNASLTATSTVVYNGTGNCPGMSIGTIICHYFEISTDASIAEINSNQTHVQGIYRPAPAPGA